MALAHDRGLDGARYVPALARCPREPDRSVLSALCCVQSHKQRVTVIRAAQEAMGIPEHDCLPADGAVTRWLCER